MKSITLTLTFLFFALSPHLTAQSNLPNTSSDVSLFWIKTGEHVPFVESAEGNLFRELGHHGPAVENLWAAYRVYFEKRHCVDVYSKFQPRLELKETKWYTKGTDFETANYGMDNYMVGETNGLGGIRLWENNAMKNLDPVTRRTAEVKQEENRSQLIMVSESVPYKDATVDIRYVMTVTPETRHAMVEVFSVSGEKVQFATGISIFPQLIAEKKKTYAITWGDHKSPLSSKAFDVGAALIFNPKDFAEIKTTSDEIVFVSHPADYLRFYITTANELETSELNNYKAFKNYVKKLSKKLK